MSPDCHSNKPPIRQILHKADLAGPMVAWAIELPEFGLIYEQWKAIKAQALVDFIVEMSKLEGQLIVPPK